MTLRRIQHRFRACRLFDDGSKFQFDLRNNVEKTIETNIGQPKRLSALAAAHKVLCEAKEPLSVQQMIEAMTAKGYWTSPGGKTPHATLYSAILRELAKGEASRFVKTDRGRFVAATATAEVAQ